jgi:hypothetical protein
MSPILKLEALTTPTAVFVGITEANAAANAASCHPTRPT